MRPTAVLTAVLLALAACGGDDDDAAAPSSSSSSTSTSEDPATSTTEASLPGGTLEPCENPAGFTISYPSSWVSNAGEVVAPCSQFHPEPFQVPSGADARVAAITAFVDPVPYATAARPVEGRTEDRAVTVIDGRQAARVSYDATGEALLPAGAPVVRYLIDVAPPDGDPATLIVDTVGTPGFDHEQNVVVLDRMARTIDLTGPGMQGAPEVVAAYRGGGGGFDVEASVAGGGGDDPQVCLAIPPGGEPVCTSPPTSDQVHTVALQDVGSVQAGVTGSEVWRVDLVTHEGTTHSYLPVSVSGADVGAYAFPETVERFERLVLTGVTGTQLRTVEPGAA